MERAAHQLARDMRMPGFRKGKVPPQLVIQRVGRDAGRSSRRSATRCPSGTSARSWTPGSPRSATRSWTCPRSRTPARSSRSRSRSAVRPRADARRVQGARGRQGRGRGARGRRGGGARPAAGGLRQPRPGGSPRGRGRPGGDRLSGTWTASRSRARTRPTDGRARSREPAARVRPGAHRRERRRRATVEVPSRTTTAREPRRQEASFAVTVKEVREKKLPGPR